MTPPEMSDRDEVLVAAATLVDAFGQGRLEDYFATFAPEATFVFHATPQRLESTVEYRALWAQWIAQDDLRILGCRSTNPLVQLLGDVAVFAHDVDTHLATRAGEEHLANRETIVFARQASGRWLAVHEHLSPRG